MSDFEKDREYDRVEELLEDLYEAIDYFKPGSFFANKTFDKENALSLIQEIRASLPSVIKQAQKFVENSERILGDATNQANKIIREAENDASALVSEHEITRRAKEEAEAIMAETKQYARDMRLGANAYAEQCLDKTYKAIQESLDEFSRQTRLTEDAINDELKIIYGHKQELADN